MTFLGTFSCNSALAYADLSRINLEYAIFSESYTYF